MKARRLFLRSIVLGLCLCGTAIAQAKQRPEDLAAAKAHFKAGQGFMKASRFADAVVEFQKAYALSQDGLVMGQTAIAFEKGGDYEAALAAIRVYRAALSESERSSTDTLIQKYEKMIREGKTQKLALPSDSASQTEPATDSAAAGEPEQAEASTVATEAPLDESLAAEADDGESAPTAGAKKERFYTWIVAGGAAALALSGLVVGLNAQSKYDELSENCKPFCAGSAVETVKTRALVADVLFGTAIAAGITAGVLYFLEGRSARTRSSDRDEGEQSTARRRVRFSPVAGSGTYGLNADVRF